MNEEKEIIEYINKEYGSYDNYVRDLLNLYLKEKAKNNNWNIKKIKMIDLINRIANEKDIPKLIEYKGKRYSWVESGQTIGYKYKGLYWFCNLNNNFDEPDFLNDEVEIIEEKE